MRDVLLPATDRIVAIQLVGVLAVTTLAVWLVRRERALIELVLGVALIVIGLMGVRALH